MHKKVNRVVEAMPYVWQHIDVKDAALVIAGGKTDNTKVLKAQAAGLEKTCEGKVYFIDNFPSEEKEDILQMSDIFICLSEMESFGIVFVEALNWGLPVIASKNSVARYIVEESETGILVEPGDSFALAKAIVNLLQDSKKAEKMAYESRLAVEKNFTVSQMVKKLENVYEDIKSRREKPGCL